jgi:hypothetical protein
MGHGRPIENGHRELAVASKTLVLTPRCGGCADHCQQVETLACWTLIDTSLISESADPAHSTTSRQQGGVNILGVQLTLRGQNTYNSARSKGSLFTCDSFVTRCPLSWVLRPEHWRRCATKSRHTNTPEVSRLPKEGKWIFPENAFRFR